MRRARCAGTTRWTRLPLRAGAIRPARRVTCPLPPVTPPVPLRKIAGALGHAQSPDAGGHVSRPRRAGHILPGNLRDISRNCQRDVSRIGREGCRRTRSPETAPGFPGPGPAGARSNLARRARLPPGVGIRGTGACASPGSAGTVLSRDLGDIVGYPADGLRRRFRPGGPGMGTAGGISGRGTEAAGQGLVSPPPGANRRAPGASLV
jgi:hypothetical protein